MRQRDVDALRAGIRQQERDDMLTEQSREHISKVLDREYPDVKLLKLIPASALLAGDKLIATDNGTSFYVAGIVRRIERTTEEGKRPAGDFWVSVDEPQSNTGSYGSAFHRCDTVLIEDRVEAAVRKAAIAVRDAELVKTTNRPLGLRSVA